MGPDDIAAIRGAIETLDRHPIGDTNLLKARHKRHLGKKFWTALTRGVSIGEADDGFRGTVVTTLDHDAHKAHVKQIANNIPYLINVLREAVDRYYRTGTGIAPYPAMRICVNLRKAKEYRLEVDFIRALLTKIPSISHASWFERRLQTALRKAKRANP